MKNLRLSVFIGFLINVLFSCQNKDELFTLLSHRQTGIKFRNIIKETSDFNILKYGYLYNGAGVGIGDINNDGLPDIFFSGNMVKSRLYLNKGNFKFEDITDKAGVGSEAYWNNGVNMVDVNGDGWLDIYISNSTDGRSKFRRNLLYINNGNLTFTEMAVRYGLDDDAYSTHSIFFDFDKDGDLDMFSLNHSLDHFASFNKNTWMLKNKHDPRYQHKFYINIGSKFVDASREVGIKRDVLNFGLGIAVADFNNDAWPDIYVCNDYFEQDHFYINNKNGTFSERLQDYFDHISLSSMGIDAADFNNDGFIDLVTLDMLPESNYEQKLVAGPDNYVKYSLLEKTGFFRQYTRNMLQVNNYGLYFTEIGQYAGIFCTNWSWASLWCDFDNDGYKDLFVSNGYGKNTTHMDMISLAVRETIKEQRGGQAISQMEMVKKVPSTILKNYIFRNNGDLTFINKSEEWGLDEITLSNGTAYADLDNDGDMDLVINNINDYAHILRNNTESFTDNNFLKIKLVGANKNTMGIGTRIDVYCNHNKQYTQEFMPSRGYMSSMSTKLVFGLGKCTKIDSLKVTWPDMRTQVLYDVNVNQTITLRNVDARLTPLPHRPDIKRLFMPVTKDTIIHFAHKENEYNDFQEQPLLHHMLSRLGPGAATGDVNGDGLTDIYIGGAKNQAGVLFIQGTNGQFTPKTTPWFDHDKSSEDAGAVFFDADGDNDLDLYVVSGGNEFSLSDQALQDRLYFNDGKGNFRHIKKSLPEMVDSGSCVKAADIDHDGDLDLFVGGRLMPGLYPLSPRSYILENDGHGCFKDITTIVNPDLTYPGMVTDAVWTDLNDDQFPDLIIVGEWMPVRFFVNNNREFIEITSSTNLKNTEGWWNLIQPCDFDKDGDTDFILGNFGLNSQIIASPDRPAVIYATDFDNNNTLDAVLCYYIPNDIYPLYALDDLNKQIPGIKGKFDSYTDYAKAGVHDIFSKEKLEGALSLYAKTFASYYMENNGNGKFTITKLPVPAQLSPLFASITGDFNSDGNPDVILAGNFSKTRVKYGPYDANKGILLAGDGNGHFREIPNFYSGFFVKGETRDIVTLDTPNEKIIVFVRNDDPLDIYLWQK